MKKHYLLGIAMIMVIIVVGCSNNDVNDELNGNVEETSVNNEDNSEMVEEETIGNESDNGSIGVEKNLFDVEITLPASLIEGEDPEEMIAGAEEEGIGEVFVNDDGSVTYSMSKSKHNEMMQGMEKDIQETIEETKNSEDFLSISDIKSNGSFSEFTIVVDQKSYENSFDGFAAFGLAMSGMFYQLFEGADPDSFEVIIHIENEETGEVFQTNTYPDDMDDW